MDDVCVHCGVAVVVNRDNVLVHRDPGRVNGPQSCLDGSGHVACLPQGGVE